MISLILVQLDINVVFSFKFDKLLCDMVYLYLLYLFLNHYSLREKIGKGFLIITHRKKAALKVLKSFEQNLKNHNKVRQVSIHYS